MRPQRLSTTYRGLLFHLPHSVRRDGNAAKKKPGRMAGPFRFADAPDYFAGVTLAIMPSYGL